MSVTVKMRDAWRHRRRALLAQQVAYHAPNEAAIEAHQKMREGVQALGNLAIDTCPLSDELDEALRALTDVVLAGFNAAIARNHDQLTWPPDPGPPS